jgi:hypothetical protein
MSASGLQHQQQQQQQGVAGLSNQTLAAAQWFLGLLWKQLVLFCTGR